MAKSGMDWMIDSVLKSAGFDPVEAKSMIGQFAQTYVDQDERLKRIESHVLAQTKMIAEIHSALNLKRDDNDGSGKQFDGSGNIDRLKIAGHG